LIPGLLTEATEGTKTEGYSELEKKKNTKHSQIHLKSIVGCCWLASLVIYSIKKAENASELAWEPRQGVAGVY